MNAEEELHTLVIQGDYNEALKKARKIDSIEARIKEIECHLELSEIDEIYDLFEACEPYQPSTYDRTRIEILKSTIYRKTGSMEAAKETLQGAYQLFNQLDDEQKVNLLMMANYEKATQHYYNGEYDEAISELLELLELDHNDVYMAKGWNLLGIIKFYRGELDDAEDYYKKSLEIKSRINNIHEIAKTLNNLGEVARIKGDQDQALIYHEQSLDLKRQIGNEEEIAISFINLGDIYQYKGDEENAILNFMHALEFFKEMEHDFYKSEVYYRLVGTYSRSDLEKAKKYLTEFEEYASDSEIPFVQEKLIFSKALYFRYNDNPQDNSKAYELFETLITEDSSDIEIKIKASLHLIELGIAEIQETNEMGTVTAMLAHLLRARYAKIQGDMRSYSQYITETMDRCDEENKSLIQLLINGDAEPFLSKYPDYKVLNLELIFNQEDLSTDELTRIFYNSVSLLLSHYSGMR
ncbi:MAG: tetratricopeptide repeat protein [Candidatus Heimdallarchaeota archaeon]|nr:tetratricopeptide repeat protein [Candidatus Heimdallarchaeota archaeon]